MGLEQLETLYATSYILHCAADHITSTSVFFNAVDASHRIKGTALSNIHNKAYLADVTLW
jgi:hypothetical protein